MKNKTQEELYNEIINDKDIKIKWQKALEEKRKLSIISIIICILVDLLIYIILKNNAINSILLIVFPIFIIDIFIYIIMSLFGKKQKEYRKEFKENIIKNIINNFYDSLEYFPNKKMPERVYDEPRYNEHYNRYYSDDYLEAKIDNKYDIEMAEVKTEYEDTSRDYDGNTNTTTTTVFHGLFAKIVIDKSIDCELKIGTNTKYLFNKNKLEMDSRRI